MLVITGPIVGIIPGPGGIPIVAAGAIMIMSQSRVAKRVFIRAHRRYPKTVGPVRSFIQRRSRRRREAAKEA